LATLYPEFAGAPEVDSKVTADEVRRPGIAVQRKVLIKALYPEPDQPLYLAIEVLSPGRTVGRRRSVPKTFAETVAKYQKSYQPWGVPYCWILDPHSREAWHNVNDFRQPVQKLEAGEISFDCAEVFRAIEELPALP
jgi:Uma2 family endonuclease